MWSYVGLGEACGRMVWGEDASGGAGLAKNGVESGQGARRAWVGGPCEAEEIEGEGEGEGEGAGAGEGEGEGEGEVEGGDEGEGEREGKGERG